MTIYECLSTILGRKINTNREKLKIGFKWWDLQRQDDTLNAIEFFGMDTDRFYDLVNIDEPLGEYQNKTDDGNTEEEKLKI